MNSTSRLGSFVVNIGHHSKIPRGEARAFQIGAASILVILASDGSVYATDPAAPDGDGKTYPARIDDAGNILIGIDAVPAARRRARASFAVGVAR